MFFAGCVRKICFSAAKTKVFGVLISTETSDFKSQIGTMKYTDEQIADIGDNIIKALKTVYDPEIPVDIYELGLVYDVQISDEGNVKVVMTLTTPNCPVAESLPQEVKEKVAGVDMVNEVDLELTFEPAWNKDMMSEEAKFELGILF